MSEKANEELHLFRFSPFLGIPEIFPEIAEGKVPIAVRFIVPDFTIRKDEEQKYLQLAQKCTTDFYALRMNQVEEQNTKRRDMLFTIAFYINGNAETITQEIVYSGSRLVVERFVGLLSFVFGIGLSAIHIQPHIAKNAASRSMRLSAAKLDPQKVNLEFPNMEKINSDEDIFAALYWLRRGLAQRDAVETFSALMVCLQIMARKLAEGRPQEISCPKCGHEYKIAETTITSQMRELIVDKLNEQTDLFEKLWKARNSIIAHGNKSVTAETLINLTELKFEAIKLAFKSIKLQMGIPFEEKPEPNKNIFITDAFMYTD
jgi:hypothetical protein